MEAVSLFLLLLAGHYLADFPLQGDHIAQNKGKVFKESIGFHCLTAHALIHGLTAAAILGVMGYSWLWGAILVAVTHWLIDFGKSWEGWPDNWRITQGAKWAGNPNARGLYGINVDQAMHVAVLLVLVVWLVATRV